MRATISDYGSTAGNMDTVKIVGKLPSEISVSRRVDQSGNLTNDLVLKINGTSDQLTLRNYFVPILDQRTRVIDSS